MQSQIRAQHKQCHVCGDGLVRQLLTVNRNVLTFSFRYTTLTPVSYTHLDVYKRQPETLLGCYPVFAPAFLRKIVGGPTLAH